MQPPVYGASPAEWTEFATILGLTADLLPVVSNPNAVISDMSKIKDVGKTPSKYNRMREVVGITNWTQLASSIHRVAQWKQEPDYGICLQTREVRALDIDIADKERAHEILDYLSGVWPLESGLPPKRSRANSGKCLLGFRMAGQFAKRILRTEHGNIEFLGNGQQFIAVGTHPSGVRYEWDWNNHADFPSLTPDQFETIWKGLVDKFGLDEAIVLENRDRKRGSDIEALDRYVDKLVNRGLVVGEGRDGQLYIDCPFRDGHSSDTGVAQTAYFPAGTKGYVHGHFHCFHASCQKYNDGDFIGALKLDDDMFAMVPSQQAGTPTGGTKDLPRLKRNKHGEAHNTMDNIMQVLEHAESLGYRVAMDTFLSEIVYQRVDTDEWTPLRDEDYVLFCRLYDRLGFKPVPIGTMRACIQAAASKHTFDSAIDWIGGLQWDGVPRVQMFFPNYIGTEDTPYTRAVGLYIWTAMAGRILVPGIQADMAPILVGKQGAGKSTAVKAMAPFENQYIAIGFDDIGPDLSRLMRSKAIAEIAELQGLATKQLETIKAFVTRTKEDWVPKYKEFGDSYHRRLVFMGTSNEEHFFTDTTGNRRWLPVTVRTRCNVPAIQRDCHQLWAEAAVLFRQNGVSYALAEKLATDVHDNYRIVSGWESMIAEWLERPNPQTNNVLTNKKSIPLTSANIATQALSLMPGQLRGREERMLIQNMKALGYALRPVETATGRLERVWVHKSEAGVLLDGAEEDY